MVILFPRRLSANFNINGRVNFLMSNGVRTPPETIL